MAFLIKNQPADTRVGLPLIRTFTHVQRATATPPASTAEEIFTITGGRIVVHYLVGEVTTVIQNQACNLKITINPTTGTSFDVASNLDIDNDEAGAIYVVEGDGTALTGGVGGGSATTARVPFIVPIGGLDIATSATNTGSIKWDLFYEPFDELAEVVAS